MTDKKDVKEVNVNDLPNIFNDIDEKSVKKSLDAGEILPRLKPRLNTVYEFIVKSTPKMFTSDYGETFSIDIDYDGMLMTLILPKSLRFQLNVEMKRKNLVDDNGNPDVSKLINKTLLIQKTVGNTKQYKNAELYSVQIK